MGLGTRATGTITGQDRDDAALARAWPAGLLLTALGLGLLVLLVQLGQPVQPGESYPSQGAPLVQDARADFSYNSSPPTSGARVDSLPDAFVLATPLLPAEQVNILAYGNVLIQYNDPCRSAAGCPPGTPPLGERLAELARLYNNEPVRVNLTHGHGVVVAPNPALPPGQVVLTAWTRAQRLDDVDRRAIEDFIEAWLGDLNRAGK